MRAKTYLRVARTSRGTFRCQASTRRPTEPLRAGYDPLPTITFMLLIDLPDDAFAVPVAQLNVPIEHVRVEAESRA